STTTLAAACGGGNNGSNPGGQGGSASGGRSGSGGAGGSRSGGSGGSAAGGNAGTGGGATGGTTGAGGVGPGGSGGGGAATGGSTGSGGSSDAGGSDAGGDARETGGAPDAMTTAAATLPAGSPCVPGMTYGDPLPTNRQPMVVKDGFSFLEGPVWVAAQNALYFSDFTLSAANGLPGRMHKYTPATDAIEVFLPTPATNGLALDAAGKIVAASHENQKLIRIDPVSKQITDVVGGGTFMGMPFNCLNDLVLRNDGNLYFTDPSYQNGGRPGQGTTAYYRMNPAGMVTRIAMRAQPNGISLSPDGKFLYVSSAEGGGIKRHAVNEDGSLGPATDFFNGISDGMAIDCGGNVYLNASNRVQVIAPSGQSLATLMGFSAANGNFVTNAAFGGPERKTLYITTAKILYRLEMNIPGLPN
ncbi:MAG TPA: SMP-30/gluconolactonase/LRE family protein, partial [Polyangia bacterium]